MRRVIVADAVSMGKGGKSESVDDDDDDDDAKLLW